MEKMSCRVRGHSQESGAFLPQDLLEPIVLHHVVVALEIAIEAFEELSDTAVAFIEDTLVLQEKGTMT